VTSRPQISRPPIATGWLLWLAWIYVVLFGLGVLVELAQLILGYSPLVALFGLSDPGPVRITWWWLVHVIPNAGFAVGCIAILMRDRDLAWFAVVCGWTIAVVQCLDAFLAVFHLRLSIPISAPIFAAFAWRTANVLGAPQKAAPPRSLGTL
jgi:hypothetical protein